MQLRHLSTVVQPGGGDDGIKMAKVMAVAWSPNNRKLAVCTVRQVKGAMIARGSATTEPERTA